MKVLNKILPSMLLGVAAVASNGVYASTAANTTITNTVGVFYQNATATTDYQAEASATFTVSLVPTAPNIIVLDTAVSGGENSTVEVSYTVTAGANGEDVYAFDTTVAGITHGADLSAATNIVYTLVGNGGVLSGGDLTLGGTTLAEELANGSSTIMVPWDGQTPASNTSVNGLTAGDIIVLDGIAYEIASVDTTGANAVSNNRATITLTTAYAGANLAVGGIIGEQATIKLSFTTGELQGGATSGDYTVTPDIGYGGGTATPDTATVTVQRPLAVIGKYVRNVNTEVAGSGASLTVNISGGNKTYYSSGVSGSPSDVMEYLIHIDNTAGDSSANNIIVADKLPEFTSINTAAIYFIDATDKDINSIAATDWVTIDPNGSNTAAEITTNNILCVFAGAGGDKTGTSTAGDCTGTGGILGPDATASPAVPAQRSLIRFQVTID